MAEFDIYELTVTDGNYVLTLACGHQQIEWDLGQDAPKAGTPEDCETCGTVRVITDVAWADE